MPAALEARAATKTYPGGTVALAGVDLRVEKGETLALLGESGCGKTTLLRLFNRTLEPTSGEIRVAGQPASEVDPVRLRRETGYVEQAGGLLPHWTVAANVELVPELLGWPAGRRGERMREMLTLAGLAPELFAERYPSELSGGQRQRVAFARALAADPETVLLDEPFGALDALTRLELQDHFLDLKRRLGKTVLLVTHDLAEAFRLGDRVAVMRDGRLLRAGRPKEILAEPGSAYVEALLDRLPAMPEGPAG